MQVSRGVAAAALMLLAVGAQAKSTRDAHLQYQVRGGQVDAVDPRGFVKWSWNTSLPQPLQVERRQNGSLLINGSELVSRHGRLLARIDPVAPTSASFAGPDVTAYSSYTWDAAEPITEHSSDFSPPVVDGLGYTWIIVDEVEDGVAKVMRSFGASGSWEVMHDFPEYFAYTGRLDADPTGNVTLVALGNIDTYTLEVARYEPAHGWTEPKVLISEPPNLGAIPMLNAYVAADANGDAVVVSDSLTQGVVAFAFSKQRQTWSQVEVKMPKATAGVEVAGLALARSPNWQNITMIYASPFGGSRSSLYIAGVFAHRFDTGSLTFDAAALVPRTRIVGPSLLENAGVRLAFVVDNGDAATLLWVPNARFDVLYGTYVSRREGGVWQKPVKITDRRLSLADEPSIAVSRDGSIINCGLTAQGAGGDSQLMSLDVVRYVPGTGWIIEQPASWLSSTGMRNRVAWIGDGPAATAVFQHSEEGVGAYHSFNSVVFDGNQWSGEIPILPNGTVFLQEMVTTSTGEMLLAYDPTTDGSPVSRIYETYLRP